MKSNLRVTVIGALVAAGLSFDASAHHSVTAYDLNTTKELAATVKVFEWTNPHTWLRVIVMDESGKQVEWALESGTPNTNAMAGWKKTDLLAGEQVTVMFHPKRDGGPSGTLMEVRLADGRVLKAPGGFVRD